MTLSFEKIIDILIFIFLVFMTFSISVTQAAFYLAFLLIIILYRKELIKRVSREELDLPLILFFLSAVISLLFYVPPVDQIKGAKKLSFFVIFLSYYIFLIRPPALSKLKKYYSYLITGFALTLIFIIIQHYLGKGLIPYRYTTFQWEGGKRVYPLYGQFSSLFLMIILPVIFFSKHISKITRGALILTLLPVVITLYLSTSRTSIISIILVSLLMLLFKGKRGLTAVLMALLLITGSLYLKSSEANLLTSVTNLTDINNPRYYSNMTRINMIKDTFDIFESNPVTGIGYNGYSYYSAAQKRKHDKIFNDTLNVLATMGILGVIPFLWLIYVLLKKNYPSVRLLKIKAPVDDFYIYFSFGIFLAYLSFLINSLFEPVFFNSKALMFMLILLSINGVIIKETAVETKASR